MPRWRSNSIQSDVVARWFLRAVTDPARWTAPPYRRNFSVKVVLPASGCEMIANVRRREISCSIDCITQLLNFRRLFGLNHFASRCPEKVRYWQSSKGRRPAGHRAEMDL